MSKLKTTLASGGAAAVLVVALTILDPTGSRAADSSDAAVDTASSSSQTIASPTSAFAASERPVGTTSPEPVNVGAAQTLAVLNTLPVKGRAPKTGYTRDQFGPRWSDSGTVGGSGNGCDTRNDILKRDLSDIVFKPGTKQCVVLSGVLKTDPYTGKTIHFTRGARSSDINIEHVVALSDAWQKGAQLLTPAERLNLANDPRNLLAVDGPANMAKGDSDAASWLPPYRSFRCQYVTLQVQVKRIYRLWVTQAEKAAMTRVLSSC